MTAIIKASNLCWKINQPLILKNISLDVQSGEVLGIIGPNGAGKSSLLKILARITEPLTGTLTLLEKPYQEIELRSFAKQVAYLEQNAPVNWPLLVEKVIALGRSPYQNSYTKLSKEDDTAIKKAIDATGIEHLLGRVISSLSQGEKMLVALSRIFSLEPKLILADEPTAALDPYHQLLIMELLQQHTQKNPDHAAVVVLHDLSLAARFCDKLLLMYEGEIVSSGLTESVLSDENLREFYKINCYSDFQQGLVQPLNRI
ncbi:MAG: ABC transporter [SAR86 cluster bacterium]|uniref:ABC transporter n=1 Tax=SAR86 cluster bacterium TaxID=2030880 RepID=A0A2A5CJS6_9GAMM|nr:MAG: ABC transporter [SAR86 cluster bacterium]